MSSTAARTLVRAVFHGDIAAVRGLLDRDVDPNAPIDEGTLPLYAAAVSGDVALVRALLGAGAQPNRESPGEGEGTPLCAAACWGYEEVVAVLLGHGADPNQPETRGLTMSPLDYAVDGLHVPVARMLLEAGSDPNRNARGLLPLYVAADRGSIALVRMLLDHGAEPAAVDAEGRSALAAAQWWIGKDVVATLQDQLTGSGGEGAQIRVQREPRPEGSVLVTVVLDRSDGSSSISMRETGHAEIAEALRGE
jgi:ankyrin repeat protein